MRICHIQTFYGRTWRGVGAFKEFLGEKTMCEQSFGEIWPKSFHRHINVTVLCKRQTNWHWNVLMRYKIIDNMYIFFILWQKLASFIWTRITHGDNGREIYFPTGKTFNKTCSVSMTCLSDKVFFNFLTVLFWVYLQYFINYLESSFSFRWVTNEILNNRERSYSDVLHLGKA